MRRDLARVGGRRRGRIASLVSARLRENWLGDSSTIWIARALPEDGRVVSLEIDPSRAAIARANIEAAGISARVEVRVGAALHTLPQLEAEAPFDLLFIDADKPNNPAYLAWALKLARSRTLIIGDNVVRDGEVANSNSSDPNVQGVRRFLELIAAEPRLEATALQMVGVKGYDWFALALVRAVQLGPNAWLDTRPRCHPLYRSSKD